jgi:Tfp pilus assembly protein PilF
MAAVCFVIGILVGFLLKGSSANPARVGASTAQPTAAAPLTAAAGSEQRTPSLEQMKQMADRRAAPVLEKLKSDPNNAALLIAVADIYKATHQFSSAAEYYRQSLEIDPKNVGVRTDMASCLYYTGDVDGALAQLNKSLTYDPKHAGTLMNIGVIRWKGKNDVPGAIAAWKKLLALNPDFPQRDRVEHFIVEAPEEWKESTQSADPNKG